MYMKIIFFINHHHYLGYHFLIIPLILIVQKYYCVSYRVTIVPRSAETCLYHKGNLYNLRRWPSWSSSSSDMRRPIKVSGECREIKHKIVIPGGFRKSGNGGSVLPTATGSGLLRNNVRVLIPILIARRKGDARVCNYTTTTDRRFAFGNKDAFIKSAPAAARPLPFSVSRLSRRKPGLFHPLSLRISPRVGLWLRPFCFFMEIVTSQKTATSSLSSCIENRTGRRPVVEERQEVVFIKLLPNDRYGHGI